MAEGIVGNTERAQEREAYLNRDLDRLLRCSGCKLYLSSSVFRFSAHNRARDFTQYRCPPCAKPYRDASNLRTKSKPCEYPGCDMLAMSRNYGQLVCAKHRTLLRRERLVCCVEGCDKPYNNTMQGKHWCSSHEYRMQKHGDCFPDIPLGHKLPDTWDDKESCVYVLCDTDTKPIYVGSSFGNDGRERLWWHLSNQPWATEIAHQGVYSLHATRGEAYEAEESLIRQYQLEYNLYNKTYTERN